MTKNIIETIKENELLGTNNVIKTYSRQFTDALNYGISNGCISKLSDEEIERLFSIYCSFEKIVDEYKGYQEKCKTMKIGYDIVYKNIGVSREHYSKNKNSGKYEIYTKFVTYLKEQFSNDIKGTYKKFKNGIKKEEESKQHLQMLNASLNSELLKKQIEINSAKLVIEDLMKLIENNSNQEIVAQMYKIVHNN